jgi:enoyl-CoA hydratase/3-hydroxyacyl-CoA dehydrogenase
MPGRTRPLSHYTEFVRSILIDDVDGIRVITIRRPEALNALHEELTDEILGAIRAAQGDDAVQGFVITGFGQRAFCAGADIGRFPSLLGDAAAAADYARACSRLLLHMDTMQKPVVAALNGMALGGGLELAIRAHGIVAVKGATLQFPEITLGIVPGIGAMVVPFRRWPNASGLFDRMLRSAERASADDASALGVVDACVERADLLPRAIALARELARRPRKPLDAKLQFAALTPLAARSADGKILSVEIQRIMERAIVDAAAENSLAAALEVGYRAFGTSACTRAAREGIEAFQARRAPDFEKTG